MAESEALEALLAQAKKGGDWDNYKALVQAPALTLTALNAVPTGRTYGVIHQLAYWGATDSLQATLARFPDLNLSLPTSKGQTPEQVAKERNQTAFIDFIKGFEFMKSLGPNTSNLPAKQSPSTTTQPICLTGHLQNGAQAAVSTSSDTKTTAEYKTTAEPTTTAKTTFTVEEGLKPGGKYFANSYIKETDKSDTLDQAWKKLATGKGSIEAMSLAPKGTVAVFSKQNMFAKAVHSAFYGHYPLILSPDIIWTTIAQGLANHVDQNAEALRKEFVNFAGKKELIISRPEFVKGSPKNDWPGVFPSFSALIKQNTVPGTTEIIESDFSTTGPVERIVSHITLMDAVQHYFSYTMACGCGFPSITLTGTPADWEKVRNKAAALKKYGLDWWLAALLPALDQFVTASKGWVQVFFPYLITPGSGFDSFSEAKDGKAKKSLRKNEGLANWMGGYKAKVNPKTWKVEGSGIGSQAPAGSQHGVKLELFPPGLSSAPFTYKDAHTGKSHKMAFYGGVTCLVQHATGEIEPKMGWAVLDSGD